MPIAKKINVTHSSKWLSQIVMFLADHPLVVILGWTMLHSPEISRTTIQNGQFLTRFFTDFIVTSFIFISLAIVLRHGVARYCFMICLTPYLVLNKLFKSMTNNDQPVETVESKITTVVSSVINEVFEGTIIDINKSEVRWSFVISHPFAIRLSETVCDEQTADALGVPRSSVSFEGEFPQKTHLIIEQIAIEKLQAEMQQDLENISIKEYLSMLILKKEYDRNQLIKNCDRLQLRGEHLFKSFLANIRR